MDKKANGIMAKPQVLEILKPYFQIFAEIYEQAMYAFINDGKSLIYKLSNRGKSTLINELVVDEAKNRLPFGNGCESDMIDGLFVVIVEQVLILRFKKLGNDLMTFNQPSGQVKRFNAQQSIFLGKQLCLPFIKEEPIIQKNSVNINVGYIPDKTLTGIHALFITAPRNEKKNLWHHPFYVDGVLLPYEKQEIPESASPKEQKRYTLDVPDHLKKDNADEEED